MPWILSFTVKETFLVGMVLSWAKSAKRLGKTAPFMCLFGQFERKGTKLLLKMRNFQIKRLKNSFLQKKILATACDDKPERAEMARLYNEMCKVLAENVHEILPLQNRLCSGSNQQSLAEAPTSVAGSSSPSIQQQDDQRPSAEQDTEMRDALTKSDPRKDSSQSTKSDSEKESSKSPCDVPTSADSHSPQVEPTCVPAGTGEDVEMEEKKNEADAAPDGSKHKSEPGIIILDD
ncbi:hypothetical protein CK203_088597 [Vitis vinifera]|uniref:CHD3-type chromatin-remodeling factor PICKLE n=1 Tax=Vitis vinifera TaxID=29760 RepID=A0A438F1K2_VITVI|nr:hypothetical protein CK203_088597 [Vitis vinifera]